VDSGFGSPQMDTDGRRFSQTISRVVLKSVSFRVHLWPALKPLCFLASFMVSLTVKHGMG
jgi:hypothetical protein